MSTRRKFSKEFRSKVVLESLKERLHKKVITRFIRNKIKIAATKYILTRC